MLTCPNCGTRNADGARFCSNCGALLDGARSIEGERKFATILFADVAHSTSIAEQLDAEDWALIMNGAFGFMNAAVSRYGGTVSRLMGDAVLALFGAPVAHEDDAERAVRAGLEIQEAAKSYAETVKRRYGVDFDLRVGINTGTAVLAFVGDAIKTEYTAMGDTANIAARLQSAAEPGTVLISADTHRLVHNQFDFHPRGAIEMRGKLAPVESYEVLGVRAAPGPIRGLEGLTSSLVGRGREMGLLRELLDGLERGIGSVVAVVGEAGLGKSRLVAELKHLRDAKREGVQPVWRESRAISYGQSIPYHPWRSLGRQIVGAAEMDAAPVVREKVAAWVEQLGLRQGDIPFYETMLAVDTEASRMALAALSGEAVVNGVAGAVVNAIKSVMRADAGMIPYVMVMDDLHWSDSATLELLAQVATLAAFEPLMLVCVLRPDRKAPSWQLIDRLQASLGDSFTRIDLDPLDAAGSSELLGNLLHIEDLPESIRAQILERSEGNPFYLEEVLRSLIDGGQVVRDGGHWRATRDILEASIPDTLAGVLSSRIDRLPDTTKRVAQTAAVIGRVFQHRVLETVCREAPAPERIEHVEPHLAALSYEQLVREKARDPEREYIFKHALTCEAAYDLLLRSRRKDLHARAGAAFETVFAERRDEFAAMLAHHFLEADDVKRALDYSLRAAGNARRLYALREELEHRENILKLLDRTPDTDPVLIIDAIIDWAALRHKLNSYAGVLERLARAVELSRQIGDRRRLALALSWTGNVHMVTGYPSRSIEFLMESQAIATAMGDEELLLLPMFVATWSLVDRDPRAGAEQLEEVIELARRNNVPDVMAHAMAYRAVALARVGEFEAAKAQLAQAFTMEDKAGPIRQADLNIAASMAYYDMGEIDLGMEHARIGAEKAASVEGVECQCAGLFSLGRGQLERRQLEEALLQFGKSQKLADKAGWDSHAPHAYLIKAGLAVAEFEKGTPEAIEKLRGALNNALAGHDEYSAADMSVQLARALVRLGKPAEAEQHLGYAFGYYRARNMRPYLAGALEVAGAMHEADGRAEEAQRARDEAAAIRAGIAAQSGQGAAQPSVAPA